MAPYRNSPPPDWAGWGGDALYYPSNEPLSGGYRYADDYDELTAPELAVPERSSTPFGQFLPSLFAARARLPQPVPPGQFLASIGVHWPQPQTVLAMRPFFPPPPPLVPLEPPADHTTLTAPQPMTGPASGEHVAGFGAIAKRLPGELEPAEGDGLWRNAAAGFGEGVYNKLGGAVDDQVDSTNAQIDDVNFLLGRNDPLVPEDQLLGSRWFARKAEEELGVPDPACVRAVTGWERAARVGGEAAASLAALLLLARRGSAPAARGPSLPHARPPGLADNHPARGPGVPAGELAGTAVPIRQWRVNETFGARRADGSGPSTYLGGDRIADIQEDLHAGRIDYSRGFEDDLSKFNPGAEVRTGPLDGTLDLVSYHADVPLGQGRSAKWWTTTDTGNGFFTINDVRQGLALPPEWGPRDVASYMRIPKGENVTALVGHAKAQEEKFSGKFKGGAPQLRLKHVDPAWIIFQRKIP